MSSRTQVCHILGNGPSLAKYEFVKYRNVLTIGTNRLLFVDRFWQCTSPVFCFSEERLLKDKVFIDLVVQKSRNYKVFASDKIISGINKLGFDGKHIQSVDKILQSFNLLQKFRKQFPVPGELEKTVVIDVAIPVALMYQCADIVFFGCEFSYGNKNQNVSKNPDYFLQRDEFIFDHSNQSAINWSDINVQRMIDIKKWLIFFSIHLYDESGGRLKDHGFKKYSQKIKN